MGRLKVDKDEPLHLKTFIYISISSYNQLGRIQHHITAAYVVDTTSQCIHNTSTSDTGDTTSVEIQNNRIKNDITCAILSNKSL